MVLMALQLTAQTYVSGEITTDSVWTKESSPYIITDSLIIRRSGFLTIQAGTIVKFRYHPDPAKKSYMVVDGNLISEGHFEDFVVFTSERDDFGGDTNRDSTLTIPRPGDWGYVNFTNPSLYYNTHRLDWTIFRYGGGRNPDNISSGEFFPMVSVSNSYNDDDALLLMQDCRFEHSKGLGIRMGSTYLWRTTVSDCANGIQVTNSNGGLIDCSIERNAGYPIIIDGFDVLLYMEEREEIIENFSGNTFDQNGKNYLAIGGHINVTDYSMSDFPIIELPKLPIPYMVKSNLSFILERSDWEKLIRVYIEKGTLIKFKYYQEDTKKPSLYFSHDFIFCPGKEGADADPVVFTSEFDHSYDDTFYRGNDRDPMPGDWGYIQAQSMEADDCIFKYGGVYTHWISRRISPDSSAILRIQAITRPGWIGPNVNLQNCLFNSLYGNGIVILAQNNLSGYEFQIHNSSFLLDKEQFGIRVLKGDVSDMYISATDNYWYGKNGPFHAGLNPLGNGCKVDDDILFDPFQSYSDDTLDLVSSVVYGTVMDKDSREIIPNALVRLEGKKVKSIRSDPSGMYYLSNVYPGYGYRMRVFAAGYRDTIVEGIKVLEDAAHEHPVDLAARTIDYMIDTITFSVNPTVSEVQEGGTAYRYYKIIDRSSRDPVFDEAVLVEGLTDTLYTNHKGIVTIPIPSQLVKGYLDGKIFRITQAGEQSAPFPPEDQITFKVKYLPRDYTKMWGGKLWLKEGISIVELKQEAGASIGLKVENSGNGEVAEQLILERGFKAGAGINLGVSAKATLGPVEAGAEAEAGVNLSPLMKDQFRFDYENSSGKMALAKFIVLAGSAFQFLDSPLHRYLGVALLDNNELVAEASYSNSVGLNLHGYGSAGAGLDLNLSGSKKGVLGAELKGKVESAGDIDFLYTGYTHSEQMDFLLSYKAEIGANASGGVGLDLAKLFGGDNEKDKDKDKKDNTEKKKDGDDKITSLLKKIPKVDLLSGEVSGGLKYGASISTTRNVSEPFTSLGFIYGYKYGAKAEAIKLLEASVAADREYEFKIDLHDSYLQSILEEKVALAREIAHTDISSMKLDISSLSGAKIFESPLSAFVAEQTKNAFSFPPVPYTQTVTDLVDEGDFKVEISFGIGPVKAKFGGGIEYTEANNYQLTSGVFYNWGLYPHQEYTYVADNPDFKVGVILQDILAESGEYMWERIRDMLNPLPRIFKKIPIWPFNKIFKSVTDGYYHIPVGPEGRNSFLVADSLTTTHDSLFVYYWDWYGTGEETAKKGSLSAEQKSILQHIRSKATDLHKLDYGIGGFYQFEPNGMYISDSAVLTIHYFDEELTVLLPDSSEYTLDETSLRIYAEDKTNNRWVYVGGIVEPENNTVTARIDSLGTFTLAPFVPYGEISLDISPDTIYLENSDSAHITSGIIYYNSGSVAVNEEYTIQVSKGSIISADSNPEAGGIQVKAEGGALSFDYRADSISGVAYLKVQSRTGSASGLVTVMIMDNEPPGAPVLQSVELDDYSVDISWEPSPDMDVASYLVYFGTESGPPYEGTASVFGEDSPVKAGTVTEISLGGLFKDSSYYFAVRAVDRSGNMSEYSNEIGIETSFNHQPVIYNRVFKIDPLIAAGTVIDQMWADDEDRDQELRFYLAANNTCTAFALDSVTGEIIVADASQLDYWLTGISSFTLQVGVRDNAEIPKADSTEVLILLNISTGMRRAPLPGEPLFLLYPNPASRELNIELKQVEVQGTIQIMLFNLQGQLLRKQEIEAGSGKHHKMDLSGILPGLYSVSVQTVKGRAVQRLVVF
jgi:hypothetical protein